MTPAKDSQFEGLGWAQRVEIGIDPTFIFDFYAHYKHILHRLGTKHNATVNRQTDRQHMNEYADRRPKNGDGQQCGLK